VSIHGRAAGRPGNQVWLTTATADGRDLSALALDLATGKIVHDIKLFHVERPQDNHAFNSYASPTPVMEPGRIYVTFGSAGTAALDTRSGKVLWERRDLECNHYARRVADHLSRPPDRALRRQRSAVSGRAR
jgi:outer membrane protein assembly factor BamB